MTRQTRQHDNESKSGDLRSFFCTDRDRLLYSSAFRRLSGVTQVVSPTEDDVFHNRLTHTLKVAQVARRLAEKFNQEDEAKCESWGGINPDVVESAALAHDLGHPPSGHIGEEELDALIKQSTYRLNNDLDERSAIPPTRELSKIEGYEGNAQSFRIITRLAVRRPNSPPGLDLTAATLRATLKYPRVFAPGLDDAKRKKYGAYIDDTEAFNHACRTEDFTSGEACVEAQIMDWADDITNCVHDVDDFYRAGRIPLDALLSNRQVRERFVDWAVGRRAEKNNSFPRVDRDFARVFDSFLHDFYSVEEPYTGTKAQRQLSYENMSRLIHKLTTETKLKAHPTDNGKALDIPMENFIVTELMKDLIWHYVILNPALGAHQYGQRKAIRAIYNVLSDAIADKKWYLFPPQFHADAEAMAGRGRGADGQDPLRRIRLVADAVSALTDNQAMRFYQRLTASSQGSVLDSIIT